MKKNYKNMKNLLIAALAIGCVATSVLTLPNGMFANTSTFSDVPSTYWANQYIEVAAANGWVSGVGNGQYNPGGTVTFAQYTVMLTRAFYPDEVAKAKVEHTEISDWWYPYAYVAKSHGILKNTEVGWDLENRGIWNSHVLGFPIMRYDMATLMANVLADKGYTVTDAEKQTAQQKISDWSQIGTTYQNSVSSVYALGVITGTADGSFNGKGNMTRAQAAVTLYRLNDVIQNGGASTSTSGKDDVQLPYENGNDTAGDIGNTENVKEPTANTTYAPADVNHDGILTEDEVYDVLMKFKEKYPTGTPWGDDKYYRSTAGIGYGCAAFAYMASDQAFTGTKRVVTHANDMRVGDLIHFTNGQNHWYIITETDDSYYEYKSASGNTNSQVSWNGGDEYAAVQKCIDQGVCTIYTRYPN